MAAPCVGKSPRNYCQSDLCDKRLNREEYIFEGHLVLTFFLLEILGSPHNGEGKKQQQHKNSPSLATPEWTPCGISYRVCRKDVPFWLHRLSQARRGRGDGYQGTVLLSFLQTAVLHIFKKEKIKGSLLNSPEENCKSGNGHKLAI